MPQPTPSVGRVVHYVARGSADGVYGKVCRAAIITEVKGRAVDPISGYEADAWVVHLTVLNPTGMFFNHDCVQHEADDDTHTGGTWHWPERV